MMRRASSRGIALAEEGRRRADSAEVAAAEDDARDRDPAPAELSASTARSYAGDGEVVLRVGGVNEEVMSIARPSATDLAVASRISTTWAACSPVARCGLLGPIAALRSSSARAPVGAAEGVRAPARPRTAPERRELDRRVELLPAREEDRAGVAVELDPALLAVLTDVEVRREPHDAFRSRARRRQRRSRVRRP